MPTLEEIRAKMAEAKRSEPDLRNGELAYSLKGAMEIIRGRLENDSCPSCGGSTPVELGFRHGGVHHRCPVCTFEFTRKGGSPEEVKKHNELICNAAVRFSQKAVREKEKKELYERAHKERRNKYTVETLPNGDMDAILHFGQFKDQRITEIGETHRGRGYLRWMLGGEFEDELKDVIRLHIENTDGL